MGFLAKLDAFLTRLDEKIAASTWKIPVALFALAMIVKIIYVVQSADALQLRFPLMDSRYYDATAQDIAAGHLVRDEAFFMGPLYPYFLGVIYATFGRDLMLVRLIQSAGGALTVALTFLLGRSLFRPTTALLGALLLCLYGPTTFFDGQLLMSWLGTLLNMAALLVLVRTSSQSGYRRYAAVGLLIGLSALARASVLAFVPVVLAWIAWLGMPDRRVRAKTAAVAFVTVVILMLVPATVHNFVASRDLVPVTSNAGLNFYIGNNHLATGYFMPLPEMDFVTDPTTRIHIERKIGRDLSPSQVSDYWFKAAFAEMRADPVAAVGRLLRKFAMFFNGYEVPQIESYDVQRAAYSSLRYLFMPFQLIAALALAAILFSWREWRRYFLPLGYILAYALTIAAFFVTSRYRVQIVPVMCLFAAHGVVTVLPRALPTPRRAVSFAVALLVLLLALQPSLFATPRAEVMFREKIHEGRRLSQAGRYPEAVKTLDEAVKLFPKEPEGYVQRAIVNKDNRNFLKAIEDYQRSLDIDPEQASVHYDLAQVLSRLGMTSEAIVDYREALRIDPLMIKAQNNLGIALREEKRYEEAVMAFRRVIELDPGYVRAYNNLGACLAESRRFDEAVDVFRRAIEVDPSYAVSFRNLSMAYSAMKQVPSAIEALKGYLALKPDDTAAAEMLRKLNVALDADSTSVVGDDEKDAGSN